MHKLQALTGALLSDLPAIAAQPAPIPEIHMNVVYIHTPPVSIYHEYSFPVQLDGFDPSATLEKRVREVPAILQAMQAKLNRLHDTLIAAPLIAATDNIFRELASRIEPDPEWAYGPLYATVYRIEGKHIESERKHHRVLGSAYIREHPLTREELLIWFSKPGFHHAMTVRQWASYLLGTEVKLPCTSQELLNYLAGL